MTNRSLKSTDQHFSNSPAGKPNHSGSIIVTTSWDDGDPLDLGLAEMLRERGLPGTFFVPLTGPYGKATLRPGDLRMLQAEGFEIGAHTVSHRCLASLKGEELWKEVRNSKCVLEDMLGQEVPMFCYPNGSYNRRTIRAVKKAGFEGARTVRMLRHSPGFNAYEMPTTVQAYPHTPLAYLRNLGKQGDLTNLYDYVTDLRRCKNWVELGKKLFDKVLAEGGIWHLYGHSWELEALNLWDELAELLDYVARRPVASYLLNTQVVRQRTVFKPVPHLATA